MSANATFETFLAHFGKPCLPAEVVAFREALWAASSALFGLDAELGHSAEDVKFEVMDVFFRAYDPRASEEERFSALWRAMKVLELDQEAAADPSKAEGLLNQGLGSSLLMVDTRILGAVATIPLRLGESITWEMIRTACGLHDR